MFRLCLGIMPWLWQTGFIVPYCSSSMMGMLRSTLLLLLVSVAFGSLKLDLSKQGWSYIPQEFDSRVTSFNLSENNITTINQTSFARYIDLVEIFLDNNPLEVIMDDAFDHNRYLKVLTCGWCKLNTLPCSFGPSTPHIRQINLRQGIKNRQIFSNDYFRDFTSLSDLDITGSKLQNVHSITWPSLLKTIAMSVMGLRRFPNLTKWRLPVLEKFWMVSNPKIENIQTDLISELSDTIEILILRRNGIMALPDISNKPNLHTIRINGNRLTTMPNLLRLNLKVLRIGDNPIICDNRMCWRRMWQWVKPLPRDNDDVNCASPPAFKGQTLMRISPKELRCYEGMMNYFILYVSAFEIDCEYLPLDILLEYWIEHVFFGILMSCLHSLLGYSTGEFQALQLIVLAAFGAVD